MMLVLLFIGSALASCLVALNGAGAAGNCGAIGTCPQLQTDTADCTGGTPVCCTSDAPCNQILNGAVTGPKGRCIDKTVCASQGMLAFPSKTNNVVTATGCEPYATAIQCCVPKPTPMPTPQPPTPMSCSPACQGPSASCNNGNCRCLSSIYQLVQGFRCVNRTPMPTPIPAVVVTPAPTPVPAGPVQPQTCSPACTGPTSVCRLQIPRIVPTCQCGTGYKLVNGNQCAIDESAPPPTPNPPGATPVPTPKPADNPNPQDCVATGCPVPQTCQSINGVMQCAAPQDCRSGGQQCTQPLTCQETNGVFACQNPPISDCQNAPCPEGKSCKRQGNNFECVADLIFDGGSSDPSNEEGLFGQAWLSLTIFIIILVGVVCCVLLLICCCVGICCILMGNDSHVEGNPMYDNGGFQSDSQQMGFATTSGGTGTFGGTTEIGGYSNGVGQGSDMGSYPAGAYGTEMVGVDPGYSGATGSMAGYPDGAKPSY